jgi:N-acetylglucosamine-6-sulfatase
MRNRWWIACALAASACGKSATVTTPPATPTPPPIQPNIVFILTDDLDVDSIAFMPALQSLLAQGGTSFSHAYTASPICAPARAALLTGRFPHNLGVYTNTPPNGGFESFFASGAEAHTVATGLHAVGYRTALIGKYLNDYPKTADGGYIPPGWDEWAVHTGAAEYFEYFMNIDRTYKLFGTTADDYCTDVFSGLAVDFIKGAPPTRQPLFLYVGTVAPHFPAQAAPRHGAEFPGAEAPRLPSFNEADVSDKPGWVRRLSPLGPADEQFIDHLYRKRLQTLLAVDEMLQALVDALRAQGELERTYFFFSSDSGFELGEHRYSEGKGLMYEESIRVPLLVRGPGVPAGAIRDQFVSQVDLLPTWLELGQAAVPTGLDGRSFAPLLQASAPASAAGRADMLTELLATSDPPPFYTLRNSQYAYTEYDGGESELYDMTADPYQLENLAHTAPAATIAPLSQRLAALRHCAGNCW